MQNQPSGSKAGIHPAFATHHAQILWAFNEGMAYGYQVGYIRGQADAGQAYFPIGLQQQTAQQRATPYNRQSRRIVITSGSSSSHSTATMSRQAPDLNPSLAGSSIRSETSVTVPCTASALSSLASFVGHQQYYQPVAGSSQMTQGLHRGFRPHPTTSTNGATNLRQLMDSEDNSPKSFQCKYCHSRFPDRLNLALHRTNEHYH
ncbi:hypothetical protein [Kistimonas scapharcae]|uniref:hypothetical protein n=1 Tax=Kistimonas scapharcae TaxID=1036133 RepID=UPI0031F0AB83